MNILKYLGKKANKLPANKLLTGQTVRQFGVLSTQSPAAGNKQVCIIIALLNISYFRDRIESENTQLLTILTMP